MVPSTRSVLSYFLQCVRSISLGHKPRTFILHCVLFWPRVFRNLRSVWSRYFPTNSSADDGKKTDGNTGRPPSTRLSCKREEYGVVCASRAFERADEQGLRHILTRSSDGEEPIQLRAVIEQSPNMPHSPSSSCQPSLQDSRIFCQSAPYKQP